MKPRTTRVFVTGASGFVGARFVKAALDAGVELALLVHPEDSASTIASFLPNVGVVRGTLDACHEWMPQVAAFAPDVALHLAWTTQPGVYLDSLENLRWLSWSGELIAGLLGLGCARIVCVGTCAEYETTEHLLGVRTPTRPETLYAASKAALRLVGEQLCRQKNARFAWARLFYVYGPGEHPDRLISAVTRKLLAGERFAASSGVQARDYIYVDDVARGLLALVTSDTEGDFNVCTGQAVTVRDLVATVARALGAENRVDFGAAPPRRWEPPVICGDPAELAALGWKPQVSLEQGVGAAVDYWRARTGEKES